MGKLTGSLVSVAGTLVIFGLIAAAVAMGWRWGTARTPNWP